MSQELETDVEKLTELYKKISNCDCLAIVNANIKSQSRLKKLEKEE